MIKLVPTENFTTSINGESIAIYTIKNQNGLVAQITNYGATLVSLWTPDRAGDLNDIVLGYDRITDYLKTENSYFGKTIGRFGNRIGNSQFSINGKTYHLNKNEGDHHLHGGETGFHTAIWKMLEITDTYIKLKHLSIDGSSGYPGNLTTTVTYSLTNDDCLQIDYTATTDTSTHINLTHHSYFNLEGQGNGNILDHSLQILADTYTAVDKDLIPTGEINPVSEALDFRESKKIATHLSAQQTTKGYDHNYVVFNDSEDPVAILSAPQSGRVLKVYATEPGLQFFTGQGIASKIRGKQGTQYGDYSGLCLEPQHFPDSPNKPHFPSTLLLAGEVYQSQTIFKFSAK